MIYVILYCLIGVVVAVAVDHNNKSDGNFIIYPFLVWPAFYLT